jgi:hypothetical protein
MRQEGGLSPLPMPPRFDAGGTVMDFPWDLSTKQVATRPPILCPAPAGLPAFIAPGPVTALQVTRLALGVAMARTGSVGDPSSAWLRRRALVAAEELADLVGESSDGFELLPSIGFINGAERTALAGRIGAGMCDLLMQSLGYVWRDQACQFIDTLKPLADFAYAKPDLHGVALAEAKGSMQAAGLSATHRLAVNAYERQVAPWLGHPTRAGDVVHGYAVGLRSPIQTSAYLCVAETGHDPGGRDGEGSDPEGPGPVGTSVLFEDTETVAPSRRGGVNASVAAGNYTAVLSLLGHVEQARLLHAMRLGAATAREAAAALRRLVPDEERMIVARSPGYRFFPTSIDFSVHASAIFALAASLERTEWRELAGQRIELPIFPLRFDDLERVQCADGLVGIRSQGNEVETEQALDVEASDLAETPAYAVAEADSSERLAEWEDRLLQVDRLLHASRTWKQGRF